MNKIWNQVKVYAKAIAAFVAGIAANVVINLFNGSTPWPQTTAEWIQLALTSFGPAIAAWFATGKITQKQLDKDPNVIGGTVVPDAQIPAKPSAAIPPASGEYRNKYRQP